MRLYVTSIDGTKNASHATQKGRGCNFGHAGMCLPWGRGMCAQLQGQLAVQMLAAARFRCNALSAMPIANGMCNATPDSSGLEGPGNLVPKKKKRLRLISAIVHVCSSFIFGCFGSGLVVATQPNAAQ